MTQDLGFSIYRENEEYVRNGFFEQSNHIFAEKRQSRGARYTDCLYMVDFPREIFNTLDWFMLDVPM